MIHFYVLPFGVRPSGNLINCAYLLTDNWNDWFEFRTCYSLVIYDGQGEKHKIGNVKIGQFEMKHARPDLPENFLHLDERFFSLGQDDSYYEYLNNLGDNIRDQVLQSLKDIARDANLFERALKEKVTKDSLLRSVYKETVTGQFHRMTQGGVRRTRYSFKYVYKKNHKSNESLQISFEVTPISFPPNNIHVIIGRNGVGKTNLLKNIIGTLVGGKEDKFGKIISDDGKSLFSGLVAVSFSAFDAFFPLPDRNNNPYSLSYSYIGLNKNNATKPQSPKSPEEFSKDFFESINICRQSGKIERWKQALNTLEADPIFCEAEVSVLAQSVNDGVSIESEAQRIFKNLSSGHKIVLLTITRLVETVEEKTLVLLDEPEGHLHPPLLSAFVRALSDLLNNRNGVALIATHSPIILQEVPKSCVWVVRRSGAKVSAERPEIQTFGENVGVLTREIFGLEVTQSGFHKMLQNAVEEFSDYDSVIQHFDNQLGDEARAIVQGLLGARSIS